MYAITHAAAALAIRRRVPEAPLWALLVAVQAVELVWVVLSLAGVEHASVHHGRLTLDVLPYSHSVVSGLGLAAVAYAGTAALTRERRIAWAVAVAVFSHVVLDILHHEPDILLAPAAVGPRLGTGLLDYPWLDFSIELACCLGCAWLAGGGAILYSGMVVLNAINLPTMLQLPALIGPISRHLWLLPLVILFQVVVTWVFVARAAAKGQA